MKKIIKAFSDKKTKYGAFSAVTLIIIFAVLVGLNLFIERLNISFDFTENKLYSLTEETIEILKDVNEKITIYALFPQGETVDILDKYKKQNNNIEIIYKNPNLYPDFVNNYKDGITPIEMYSLIVENNETGFFNVITPMELQSETQSREEFAITNGIAAVLKNSDILKQSIYYIGGHNETELSEEYILNLKAMGYGFGILNLMTDDIPHDVSMLIMSGTSMDYSEAEISKIKNYLETGGSLFMATDLNVNKTPNLKNFLLSYGVEIEERFIFESDPNLSIQDSNDIFFTSISQDESLTTQTGMLGPLVYYASPITVTDEKRQTLKVVPLFVTSKDSYAKTQESSQASYNFEKDDTVGPFSVAVNIIEDNADGSQSNIFVISSQALLSEEFGYYSQNINPTLLFQTVSYLAGEPDFVYVPKKSTIDNTSLLLTNQEKRSLLFSSVCVPTIILGIGVFVWYRRRHK